MIVITHIGSPNIYSFRITDEVTREDILKLDDTIKHPEDPDQPVQLLQEVPKMVGYADWHAFLTDVRAVLEGVEKVDRYAVVADIFWLEALVPIGNFLVGNVRMRYFPSALRERAIDWLKNDTPELWDKMEIQHMPSEANIYRFVVNGKVNQSSIREIYDILSQDSGEQNICLLGVFQNFSGFSDLSALVETFKADLKMFKNIRKYAILTESKVVTALGELEKALLPNLPVRAFDIGKEEEAVAWLKE